MVPALGQEDGRGGGVPHIPVGDDTDEPNVTMDSANLFLVRLGVNVSFSRYQKFASLLFTNEWEAMLRGF